MRNLTITQKITLGFSLILILLGISTIVSHVKIGEVAYLADVAQEGIKNEAFLTAKEVDHLNWASSLSDSIISEKKVNVQIDPRECGFGKWLYQTLSDTSLPTYILEKLREIEPVHASLHQSAKKIKDNFFDFDVNLGNMIAQRWSEHLTWIKNLQEMFLTGKKFTGGVNPRECKFGKWFYQYQSNDKEFMSILASWEAPHTRLHESAHEILNLWEKGEKEQAKAVFNNKTLVALADLERHYSETMNYINAHLPKKIAIKNDYKNETIPHLHATQKKLEELRGLYHRYMLETAGTAAEDVAKTASLTQTLVLIFGIISLVVGVVSAYLITRSIVNPIKKVSSSLNSITNLVASAAQQLSSGSMQLSSSSNQQASSVEQTSSALEQMGGMIETNVENAEKSYELSNKVKDISTKSNETMQSLQASMQEILVSNEKIGELVKVIGNIGEKTQIMDEIVFQTKLLSFNASVEAERAGEHGRGFAVVAQEVGNLAQMSGNAAQEIAVIVKDSIKDAQTIATDNKEKVEHGRKFLEETAVGLKEVIDSSATLATGSKQVLSASQDQAKGIDQISIAMNEVDKATQQNAATAEETASSSEELDSQVKSLNDVVINLMTLVEGDSSSLNRDSEVRSIKKPAKTQLKKPRSNIVKLKNPAPTLHNPPQMQQAAGAESYEVMSKSGSASDEWEKL